MFQFAINDTDFFGNLLKANKNDQRIWNKLLRGDINKDEWTFLEPYYTTLGVSWLEDEIVVPAGMICLNNIDQLSSTLAHMNTLMRIRLNYSMRIKLWKHGLAVQVSKLRPNTNEYNHSRLVISICLSIILTSQQHVFFKSAELISLANRLCEKR